MASKRVGGTISFTVDGELFQAKGSFTLVHGKVKREVVVGHDRVHGFKELPMAPKIEGTITDDKGLDWDALIATDDATIRVQQANGKIFLLRNGFWTGENEKTTEEGEIPVSFHGMDSDEV